MSGDPYISNMQEQIRMLADENSRLERESKDLSDKLANCDRKRIELISESEKMRKALILAKPCVERDMRAAVHENFGIVGNDPWASSAVDARDAIVEALS